MRGRGRRSRMRRGTATTGTIANTTWAATGKYGKRAQLQRHKLAGDGAQLGLAAAEHRDDAGGVGQPDHVTSRLARRDLEGQRQLLPRRHLRPQRQTRRRRHLRHQRTRTTALTANTLGAPGRHLRQDHDPPLRQRHPGLDPRRDRRDHRPPPTRSRSAATPSTASTSAA